MINALIVAGFGFLMYWIGVAIGESNEILRRKREYEHE